MLYCYDEKLQEILPGFNIIIDINPYRGNINILKQNRGEILVKNFIKIKSAFIIFILVFMCANLFSCSDGETSLYNGEFLEKKLTLPYNIEGVLTQNGEKYDVIIESSSVIGVSGKIESGTFKVKFMSGDVTEGLTVEFFDNGVFLFFDDLRFKTNSAIFTNLESLKAAFETLSAPYVEKYVISTTPVEGTDILEIGVNNDAGDIKAYINKIDGSIIRLTENLNGTDIILDVKKFENLIDISRADDKTNEIFDVVDDYIFT